MKEVKYKMNSPVEGRFYEVKLCNGINYGTYGWYPAQFLGNKNDKESNFEVKLLNNKYPKEDGKLIVYYNNQESKFETRFRVLHVTDNQILQLSRIEKKYKFNIIDNRENCEENLFSISKAEGKRFDKKPSNEFTCFLNEVLQQLSTFKIDEKIIMKIAKDEVLTEEDLI